MDSLGGRMKRNYEDAHRMYLPMRMPVILRLDGRSFHSLRLEKPFDARFSDAMNGVAMEVCKDAQGAQIAYLASDEISILLHNYKRLDSEAWFGNNVQKMVSCSAAMASVFFSRHFWPATFDARVFVLPETEVCNYFLWRQRDWERNSVQMLARSLCSHKECHGKKLAGLHDLIVERGKNWNDLPTANKRGRCVVYEEERGWYVDEEIPIFSEDRNYIERKLAVENEEDV